MAAVVVLVVCSLASAGKKVAQGFLSRGEKSYKPRQLLGQQRGQPNFSSSFPYHTFPTILHCIQWFPVSVLSVESIVLLWK